MFAAEPWDGDTSDMVLTVICSKHHGLYMDTIPLVGVDDQTTILPCYHSGALSMLKCSSSSVMQVMQVVEYSQRHLRYKDL